MKTLTIGLGQRPHQSVKVTTRDGTTYNLGRQVSGDDPLARWYQWRQRRKIDAYCRDRLKTLTGPQRDEFLKEMEAHRG